MPSLQDTISALWANPDQVKTPAARAALDEALALLDSGAARVAERNAHGQWQVNIWLKQAILLSFRARQAEKQQEPLLSYDKMPLKCADWSQDQFKAAGFRLVPGAVVRYGAFVARDVVLMPCFVNTGAFIGEGTMIDTWATVGSCAQVGKHCHISGGVGLGGVLEPVQATPVIIEDHVFIGARSEVAEGVIVREGAVLSMGVFLGASTKIVDRTTGKITYGEVPANAVVVPGSLPGAQGGPHLACAVIVKYADAQTRAKTGINQILRDAGEAAA